MRFRTTFPGLLLAVGACVSGDQTGPVEPDFAITATAVVGSVAIVPGSDTINTVGGSVQLGTIIKDPTGQVLAPGSFTLRWASLNPKRATVSASGKVTSLVSIGQARITATAGTRVDTALVMLIPAPIRAPSTTASSITVAPSSITQTSGSALISVIVRDSTGAPVPNATVTINASGTGNIVAVPAPTDSNGVTTALFSSTTAETKTITATANGVTLSQTTLTVSSSLEAVATIMSCVIPTVPTTGTVNLVTDVVFDSPGGIPQKLDIAWPRTTGLHPVVVVVHGGGWYQGDKATFRNSILQLASQGYTAIAVNYRLVSGTSNTFPAAAQDVRCALRWINANAATYSLDPNRGAAVGVSAGAHLALLLGLAPEVTKLDGPCSVAGPMVPIKAVVSYEGPSDMRQSSLFTSQSLPTVTSLLGGAPESVPLRAATASPITHGSAGDPKTLLVHGTMDSIVPWSHSASLKTALNQASVPATYLPVQGVGHTLQLFSILPIQVPASCTTLEFLKQELQP